MHVQCLVFRFHAYTMCSVFCSLCDTLKFFTNILSLHHFLHGFHAEHFIFSHKLFSLLQIFGYFFSFFILFHLRIAMNIPYHFNFSFCLTMVLNLLISFYSSQKNVRNSFDSIEFWKIGAGWFIFAITKLIIFPTLSHC